MANFEKATVGEKLSNYLEDRRKIFAGVLIVVVAVVAVYATVVTLGSKSSEKGLAVIDSISYVMTQNSAELSEEELDARRNKALDGLEAYLNKGGIVGVRANMLAGEIAYSKKDYAASAKFWNAAALKNRKAYTAPVSYFNAGVSYENADNLDNAEKCYMEAAADKDFLMSAHAQFSLGRVREAKGDKDGAVEAYKTLNNKSPDSSWGKLAKTRLIALSVE